MMHFEQHTNSNIIFSSPLAPLLFQEKNIQYNAACSSMFEDLRKTKYRNVSTLYCFNDIFFIPTQVGDKVGNSSALVLESSFVRYYMSLSWFTAIWM